MAGRLAILAWLLVCGGCSLLGKPTPDDAALDDVPAPAPTALTLNCIAHPTVVTWERKLRNHHPSRRETRESLARGARYLPEMRAILADAGVPPSLAFLPVVESAFWPEARGPLDELGLWQLRPDTARRFGLHVEPGRDDRTDPTRSTRAAARYLRYLHRRYSDWPLALAAYNAGERRVDRELAREPHATFWSLAEHRRLPRTSRQYVPRFLAVVRFVEGAQRCAPPTSVAHADTRPLTGEPSDRAENANVLPRPAKPAPRA
jgi:transglycosylase-like protein with SLT domain